MSLDLDRMIDELRMCITPKEPAVKALGEMAKDILKQESNVLVVSTPVVIVGDIHGQFYDLRELFMIGGPVPLTNYVFMGDYVDRGFYSVETLLLLVALKVRHPDRVHLVRGNHESRQITQVYGFYDECLRKFGNVNVWRTCAEVFDHMALAALVADKVLSVHGGLSPSLTTIDQINDIDRFMEVPNEGPMCDLMWSDPEDVDGWAISPRGAGHIFGADVVAKFCKENNLDLVTRSHQLVMEGFKSQFDDLIVTVWSAPNYCYRCGNVASILEIDEKLNRDYKVFDAAPQEVRGPKAHIKPPEYFI
eukprot:Hpha_TRINITY_DN15962_c0_g1::TRINITY_DN15962_c0_g1_i6::g.74560::m.74560/K15423/PPP4C; serine/threonine-protein phosphatase 4 catalytic subunit